MFSANPSTSLNLPVGLTYYGCFIQESLDDTETYLVVQFQRPVTFAADLYYVAILPADVPVNPKDVKAVFDSALVWDCAADFVSIGTKVAAWLGEAL